MDRKRFQIQEWESTDRTGQGPRFSIKWTISAHCGDLKKTGRKSNFNPQFQPESWMPKEKEVQRSPHSPIDSPLTAQKPLSHRPEGCVLLVVVGGE